MADLILLGEEYGSAPAPPHSLDLDAAKIISTSDRELSSDSPRPTPRPAHKGMTIERAREIIPDVSYFGTMMVHLGLADGMVSGAINTTAHTIRPALEFVKTKPGVSTVSSVFLMCLADRVLVYGDCAVIPEPTTEQLADIAISSAETARQFGIEPRVAMLSYSTGSSGAGADVERVRAATALAAERAPDLLLRGPIQYDAAVDPDVAKTKLPDSKVAGGQPCSSSPTSTPATTPTRRCSAVPTPSRSVRCCRGCASRSTICPGALVEDIVNTVAITAVQAQAIS